MTTEAPPNWEQIEAHYRKQAQDWEARGKKITDKVDGMEFTEESAKKIQSLTRFAGKCAVQAIKYYELADRAKAQNWQDEASEVLSEMEEEENRT